MTPEERQKYTAYARRLGLATPEEAKAKIEAELRSKHTTEQSPPAVLTLAPAPVAVAPMPAAPVEATSPEAAIPPNDAPASSKPVRSSSKLFTKIPDSEHDAILVATDGTELAPTLIAIVLGVRRALRESFRTGRSESAYGPAPLLRSEICRYASVSPSTLNRAVPMLVAAGVLEVTPGKKPGSRENLPTIYALPHEMSAHNAPRGSLTMRLGSPHERDSSCVTSEETGENKETKKTLSQSARLPISFSLQQAQALGAKDSPELKAAWEKWCRHTFEKRIPTRSTVEAHRATFLELGAEAPITINHLIAAGLHRLESNQPRTSGKVSAPARTLPDNLRAF